MAETEVVNGIGSALVQGYQSVISVLPLYIQNFINFFLIVLLVVVYSIFVWKLYRFIAAKNFLGLDLSQYNKAEHPFLNKLLASFLYFIEYIIVLPFLVFFWFAVFTLFLIFLTENIPVSTILLISATIIAAIRMTSYYNEDLSKDLAKFLPFTLLTVSLLTPGFFSSTLIEKIGNNLSAIPDFFSQILYYLTFIILLEIVLRFFDFIISLFGLEEVEVEPAQTS